MRMTAFKPEISLLTYQTRTQENCKPKKLEQGDDQQERRGGCFKDLFITINIIIKYLTVLLIAYQLPRRSARREQTGFDMYSVWSAFETTHAHLKSLH